MREIVLDTETTGLDPLNGDRIVEIGAVELLNFMPTGKVFHTYLNPERNMPDGAARVHGLTDEFLADKPIFASVVDDLLTFIADDPLVIHNAPFDMSFVNVELTRLGFQQLPPSRATDTLTMARQKYPGAPNSLDALCKRLNIDASDREWHGALLDARLLAEVYLELRGGRQPGLAIGSNLGGAATSIKTTTHEFRAPRTHAPTEEEKGAHQEFLAQIENPMWNRLRGL
jgi:DNA polymerase III subunit epsilon